MITLVSRLKDLLGVTTAFVETSPLATRCLFVAQQSECSVCRAIHSMSPTSFGPTQLSLCL